MPASNSSNSSRPTEQLPPSPPTPPLHPPSYWTAVSTTSLHDVPHAPEYHPVCPLAAVGAADAERGGTSAAAPSSTTSSTTSSTPSSTPTGSSSSINGNGNGNDSSDHSRPRPASLPVPLRPQPAAASRPAQSATRIDARIDSDADSDVDDEPEPEPEPASASASADSLAVAPLAAAASSSSSSPTSSPSTFNPGGVLPAAAAADRDALPHIVVTGPSTPHSSAHPPLRLQDAPVAATDVASGNTALVHSHTAASDGNNNDNNDNNLGAEMADDSEHRRGSIAAIQLEDLLIPTRPARATASISTSCRRTAPTDPLALLPDVISNKPWGSDSVSYMSEQLPVEDMVHVLQHVGRNRTVRKLYLSGNNVALTDEVMPILCRSLQTNTTLSYLNLASCSISTRGAAALGIALRSNRTLSVLLVQDNSFLEDGAIAFARTLAGPNRNAKNTVLRALNLSGNAIMDTGFAALSHGIIRSLVGLVELHLVSNCITDESAMHIAHLVASHPALEELYLQENRLGNATVLAVDKALTKPPMAGNMSPSRSGSTRRQLSTGIPLASFASLPSGLDQARSTAPSTSFAALHPTPSPTLLSPIQSAFSSSSLSTSPLPPASPSSPSVSPSWLSILSSPFSASPSSANSQRSASPPTGQLVQPLHFSNIRVVNFLANTRITLRSRAVVNRSRLWWKHKHEVRYRMDRPVRLSMHTTL